MNLQSLIKKYARGLVRAVADESEFLALREQLHGLFNLMISNEEINFGLSSPFIPRSKRIEIIKKLGENLQLDRRMISFLILLIEHERIFLLRNILNELDNTWAEEHGYEVFEVSSAVELTETEKERVRQALEQLEKKPVRVSFHLEPEIIGGLVLRKGNVFYDISIKGNLTKLKEIISQG